MELVFQYMFSLYVFYLWQFWWILLGYIKARFWPVLVATLCGHFWIRKDYIGISLVVFPCSFLVIFLYYYLSYSCIILGQFHVCQLADHHLLLYLPKWAVAYAVFLLVVSLVGSLVSVTLLGIIMTLDVSIMSHHVFIMIWYHNESFTVAYYESKQTYCLRNSVSIKDLNYAALDCTVFVQHSLVQLLQKYTYYTGNIHVHLHFLTHSEPHTQ